MVTYSNYEQESRSILKINNYITCITEKWTRVVASLCLTFEKKKGGISDVNGGSCWTAPLQRRTGGPGGQQGDCEPASSSLDCAKNRTVSRADPSPLSLSSIEGMAGMWGLSSMFSCTIETQTFWRKFTEGTGASFVQKEGEKTLTVQPEKWKLRRAAPMSVNSWVKSMKKREPERSWCYPVTELELMDASWNIRNFIKA